MPNIITSPFTTNAKVMFCHTTALVALPAICKNLARIGIVVAVFYYTSFLFILLDNFSTLRAITAYAVCRIMKYA
jgi:hypothetical protein